MKKATGIYDSGHLPTKKKVISFSLWGDNRLYTVGAIKNADLAPKIYPGWICRFYKDATVPSKVLENLARRDYVEIVSMDKASDGFLGSFWRFLAISDPEVEITIIRDVDSRLNWREKAAVDEWLASNLPFHIMRDHPWHKSAILAGMWGVKGNLEIQIAMANYLKKHSNELVKGIDQKFLAEVIYPLAKYQSLVHDEFFGGKPFPQPRQNNEYVGQIFRSDDSKVRELDEALERHLSQSENSQLKVAKEEFARGQNLKKQGKYEEAAVYFEKAIAANKNHAAAYNNLGSVRQIQNRLTEAFTCYQSALKINPNFHHSISNIASIYLIQGELNKAAEGFHRVLKIKPDYVHALYHLGLVYKQKTKLEDAIKLFQKAVKHQPNLADAHFQLGQICEMQSQYNLAKIAYERIKKINPQFQHLLGNLTFVELNLCNWENYDAFVKELTDETAKYVKEEKGSFTPAPFHLNTIPLPPELHLAVARTKAKSIASKKPQFSYSKKSDKLRVGYVSGDFYGHALGRLISAIFELHNRDKFEIFGYQLLNVKDEVTKTIKKGCDKFRIIGEMSVENAAQKINNDGIDILIDLAGYTANGKTEIFARRPAPIQAAFLGYPNTMGADFIPYLLADKWVVPPELAEHYSEEIIYLPHQFPCSPMEISPHQFSRAEMGLPETGFVFACFNRHYKITPELFDVWMRVLQQVEGSVLWLSSSVEEAIANLRNSAATSGIAPERLIFAEKLPHPEYLARLQLADLALDTLIYNGGSTTVAALYAGLPVLTKPGSTNAARMGASICASGGLEELICQTLEEYEAKAVHLATHPEELQQLRQRLKSRNAPLFDLSGFVASLEAALEGLLTEHR